MVALAPAIVQDLLEKSEALLRHLQSYRLKKDNRDGFINHIQRLLDEREATINRLKERPTIELKIDKEINARIVEIEPEITRLLQMIFNDVQQSRQLLKKSQHTRERYTNPYANMSIDGAFLDKRK